MLRAIDTANYTKGTVWCGPAALATLTGLPVVRTTEMLSRITQASYADLEGVWNEEMILALHELGYRLEEIDVATRFSDTEFGPTLKRFLRERNVMECSTPMLIEVSGHYVTAHFGYLCDNWTMRPIAMDKFPKPQRLVKRAWMVRK